MGIAVVRFFGSQAAIVGCSVDRTQTGGKSRRKGVCRFAVNVVLFQALWVACGIACRYDVIREDEEIPVMPFAAFLLPADATSQLQAVETLVSVHLRPVILRLDRLVAEGERCVDKVVSCTGFEQAVGRREVNACRVGRLLPGIIPDEVAGRCGLPHGIRCDEQE